MVLPLVVANVSALSVKFTEEGRLDVVGLAEQILDGLDVAWVTATLDCVLTEDSLGLAWPEKVLGI